MLSFLLTIATVAAAGWIIDRLAFNGDMTAIVRDEIDFARARRRSSKAAAAVRRRAVKR